MSRILRRLVGLLGALCFAVFSLQPQAASALDTPNTLMGIDAMVMRAAGIFRSPDFGTLINGNDGFNTFQFGSYAVQNPITAGLGRYDAFRFQKTDVGDCCISHNARFNSNTPEHMIDSNATPQAVSYINSNLTKDLFPIIDKAAFGQRFDPAQYQIEVKFKPLLQKATADALGTNPFPTNPTYPNISAALENTAPFFQVSLDQHGGYVWDDEVDAYKRAAEQIFYNIGSDATPAQNLNNWYAAAPHDAQGYATFTVPITSPSDIGRSPYFSFGDADFRTNNVVTNGGRRLNETTQLWEDVEVGYGPNFDDFGGGPFNPDNPSSKLDTPNGVGLMYLGSPSAQLGLSLEIKSIGITKKNPGTLVARIDADSGIGFRFGTGLTYGETQPPLTMPGVPIPVTPAATDQISRFDLNGMTNLKINMRTPNAVDPTPETPDTHRFIIRSAAVPNTIDATDAVVNVRAKLLQPLTDPGIAQSLTLVAKARKGNDTAANLGADEWNYVLPLNLFNTSTMTTVSIPMSAFTRNMNSSALGAAPAGFANSGDGTLTNFGLYEFGGLVPFNTGLLKLELEFMEMRIPAQGLIGDYNDSGVVDAADYTIWRNNVGQPGSTLANRDPNNGSGNVGPADYASWKAHFGEGNLGSGSLTGANVPEPTTLSLLVLSLSAVALKRRER